MSTYNTISTDYITKEVEGQRKVLMKKQKFEKFNKNILGLGDLNLESKQINALSVIFDLEGFTNFCKQIDPQLAVPEYLNEFLTWIFEQVRKENIEFEHPEGIETYTSFPFLSKYLGDGILFLYNTADLHETAVLNIVISMIAICRNYTKEFLPMISKKITSPPLRLRCGIARGAIYSVGNGNDFVGPCINMSSRLQKLSSLTFCFSRRGLNPAKTHPEMVKQIITKKIEVRGVGEAELVCILKNEFDALDKITKKQFTDP